MSNNDKTSKLVLTALMVCLVLLATYIIKIPSPFTQGYVHLGDTMIFLSVLLLGKKGGAAEDMRLMHHGPSLLRD